MTNPKTVPGEKEERGLLGQDLLALRPEVPSGPRSRTRKHASEKGGHATEQDQRHEIAIGRDVRHGPEENECASSSCLKTGVPLG
jgi:hypothetical protein